MTPEEFVEKWCPARMVDRLNENLNELKVEFILDLEKLIEGEKHGD